MKLHGPLILLWLLAAPVAADQYRSKIYLDPNLQLGESASQSLEQLEAQFDQLDDDYAKSSAGRQLAEHFIRQGEYDKAAAYYETTLAAGGLSEIVNREILKQLAALYLRQEAFTEVVTTLERLEGLQSLDALPSDERARLLLILTQSHSKLNNHLAVERTLSRLMQQPQMLTDNQLRQVLALYYRAGNYPRCEALLKRLIQRNPEDGASWLQLTSILLAQDKQRAALDRLALAREKRVPFDAQDWLLLSDLFIANGAAERGARLLGEGLESGRIKADAEHYRRLFEAWLRAREPAKAMAALQVAARLSGDTELYLKLAQLQMERQRWPQMQATIEQACQQVLADRYVSRANLLLGISQHKQGQHEAARRAFINATLVGSSDQPGQWLRFIQAAPATFDDLKQITPPCQPADPDTRHLAAQLSRGETAQSAQATQSEPVEPVREVLLKTVPKQTLYLSRHRMPGAEIERNAELLAIKLGMALIKGGGSIDGPLMMIFDNIDMARNNPTAEIDFKLAFAVRGRPRSSGKYRVQRSEPFTTAYRTYHGPEEGLDAAWLGFYSDLLKADLNPSGEQRLLWSDESSDSGMVRVELQIGIQADSEG